MTAKKRTRQLAAKFEPFDSFWEAPDDIEAGYDSYGRFYRDNYWKHLPAEKDARILCVSCGPGYLVKLLQDDGYTDVLGVDSFPDKIAYGTARGLNCRVDYAFDFLQESALLYDLIFCEQELNHLTRDEILDFLDLCWRRLESGGKLVCFALNGANPVTGAEALAQNFDHFNTFTEYTMRQVLRHSGFTDTEVFGLNLYVYYRNPANYAAMAVSWFLSMCFRACFILYGKKNRIFTKKFAAVSRKPAAP